MSIAISESIEMKKIEDERIYKKNKEEEEKRIAEWKRVEQEKK